MPDSEEKPDVFGWSNKYCWISLLLIIIGSAVIRGRLASMPLERDEGEYAYIAQQMLKGVPPYESAYSMKLPGIYVVYAAILALFGQTQTGIHVGLIIFNSATVFVIFLLARRLFDPFAGVAAAGAYAVTSMVRPVLGLSANAEHFVILPALLGILLLLETVENRKLPVVFISAILLGLAFIIKQHGIFFPIFALAYLLYKDLVKRPVQWKKAICSQFVFICGAALPFALVCFLYWRFGLFDKFWFWTFTYASKYATTVPPDAAWFLFKGATLPLLKSSIPVWLLALAGLLLVFICKSERRHLPFIVGFLIFSFLTVLPGFYFRVHYFILFLPAAAILAGLGFKSFCDLASYCGLKPHRVLITAAASVVVIGYSLFNQRAILFNSSVENACVEIYGGNPFPESIEVAEYIKKHSSPQDTIAVIGSEPQIYFYSERRSATRYIYAYPYMETHNYAAIMQRELIQEIETAKPKIIVYVKVYTSWLGSEDSPIEIIKWFDPYINNHYTTAGIVDLLPDEPSYFLWSENGRVINYAPRSPHWIAVFIRNG